MWAPGLARLVDKYGPPEALVVSTTGSTFYALTRAIVGQQLSVTAAGTIYGRFRTVCGVSIRFLVTACWLCSSLPIRHHGLLHNFFAALWFLL